MSLGRNIRAEAAQRARKKVAQAIKRGRLSRPNQCSRCGSVQRMNGHHEDYLLPLCVEWVCPKCHGEIHSKKRRREEWETIPIPAGAHFSKKYLRVTKYIQNWIGR
jgi:hypothetical protein